MKDFEDAVLVSAAGFNNIQTIITRNKKDFTYTSLRVVTPKEFLGDFRS